MFIIVSDRVTYMVCIRTRALFLHSRCLEAILSLGERVARIRTKRACERFSNLCHRRVVELLIDVSGARVCAKNALEYNAALLGDLQAFSG